MNKLFFPLLLFVCLFATACSDDEPKVPTNAIPVNLSTGDSNSTIGGSDVYINSSNNFITNNCGISDSGRKGGFDKNPDLSQIAREVAVTPGNYYQIFNAGDIKSVAGERAYPINTSYYNAYFDSWIYDKSNDITGAKIIYAEWFPKTNALPEWDSSVNIKLNMRNDVETAAYTFAKGSIIDNDIISYDMDSSDMRDRLDIDINENQISFSNSSWSPNGKVKVIVLVRYGNMYTRTNLIVESSM